MAFPCSMPCPSCAPALSKVPPARAAHPCPSRGKTQPGPARGAQQSREVTGDGGDTRGQDAALATNTGIVSLDTCGMKSEAERGAAAIARNTNPDHRRLSLSEPHQGSGRLSSSIRGGWDPWERSLSRPLGSWRSHRGSPGTSGVGEVPALLRILPALECSSKPKRAQILPFL